MDDLEKPEICHSCGDTVRIAIQKGTGACCQNCARLLGQVK
jgi:DNA-directed RNA polymerase subunit RPC12/RpoP